MKGYNSELLVSCANLLCDGVDKQHIKKNAVLGRWPGVSDGVFCVEILLPQEIALSN
jgi:hypothetical protein